VTERTCVVIAPHFDDAAFSVAGAAVGFAGDVTFVTVHGGPPTDPCALSEWDRDCGFTSGAQAAAARAAEDLSACAVLGVGTIHLPLPDGPYLDDTSAVRVMSACLSPVLAGADLVLAPAGIGSHPDHLRVRDVVLSLLAHRTDDTVRLFADLPYASWAPDWGTAEFGSLDEFGDVFGGMRPLLDTHWLSAASATHLSVAQWAAKKAAIACHSSQIEPISRTWPNFAADQGPLMQELLWSVAPISTEPPPWPIWTPAVLTQRPVNDGR
jgi:LmbE family N-acetylglucosaminyl deacetylase